MKKIILSQTLVPLEAGAEITARSGSQPIILVPTVREQMPIAGLDKPQKGPEQNDSERSVSSKYKQGKAKTSGEETFVPRDQQKASARGRKGQQMLYFCKGEEIANYTASYTAQHTSLGLIN